VYVFGVGLDLFEVIGEVDCCDVVGGEYCTELFCLVL